MQRWLAAVLVLVLGGGILVMGDRAGRSLAQDATPDAMPPAGVERQELAVGDTTDRVPGGHLRLVRYTLDAGAEIEVGPHPAPIMEYIEEGAVAFTVQEGVVRVRSSRAIPGLPEDCTQGCALPLGRAVELLAGDSVFHEGADYAYRNAGNDRAVVLVSGLVTPEDGGTPGPSTPEVPISAGCGMRCPTYP